MARESSNIAKTTSSTRDSGRMTSQMEMENNSIQITVTIGASSKTAKNMAITGSSSGRTERSTLARFKTDLCRVSAF